MNSTAGNANRREKERKRQCRARRGDYSIRAGVFVIGALAQPDSRLITECNRKDSAPRSLYRYHEQYPQGFIPESLNPNQRSSSWLRKEPRKKLQRRRNNAQGGTHRKRCTESVRETAAFLEQARRVAVASDDLIRLTANAPIASPAFRFGAVLSVFYHLQPSVPARRSSGGTRVAIFAAIVRRT